MSSSRSRNGHAAATASPLINGTSSKMIDHRSYRQGPEAASSDQGGIIYHNDPGMMFSRGGGGGSSSRTKPTTLSTSSSASSSPSLSLARDGSHPAIGSRENATRPEHQHQQPSRGNLVKQMVDNLYVNASSKSPVPSLTTTGSRASFRNGHTTTPMSPSTGQRSFISNFKTQLSEPGGSSAGQPAYDNLSPTSSKGRTTFDSPSLDRKSITRASLPLGYHGYQRSGSGLSTASSSTASGQTYGKINQGGSGKGGGHSSKKYLDGDPIDPQTTSPTPTMTWVEILEPRSRHRMFANLNTGECRWEEPKGVPILRANNPNITQWWELYDPKTGRFYYYSSRDFKTIWQKPTSPDAVVVPLAKLQILKQNTAHHHHPHGSHLNESFDSGTAGNSSSGHVTPSSPSLSSPSHPFGSRLKAWSNGGAPFGPIASPVAPVLIDAGTQTQAPMTTKPTMISRWTQTVNVTPTHSRSNHRPGSRRPLPNPGPQPTQPSLHHYLLSEKRFAKGRYSMGVPPGPQPHPVSDGIYDPVYGSNSTGLVYGNASDFYDLVAADPVPNYQALGGGGGPSRGPRNHQDYYDDVYEEEYYDEDDFYEDEDDLEDEESDGSYCDADDEFGEAEEDEDEESVDTEEDSEDEECDFDESESEVDQVDGQRHRVMQPHVQQQQGPPPYQHHQDLGAGQFVRGHSTRQPLQVATRASVKMASVKVPQTDTKVANGGGGGGGGPEGLRMSASFSAVDFKRNALGRSSYTPSLHQYQQQQQSSNAHAAPPTTTAAQSYSNPFNSGSLRSSTGRITSQAAVPASAAQRSSTSSNIADRIQLFNQKSGPTGGGPPGGQSSPSPVIIHRTPSSPPGVQQTSTPISRESSARHSSDASSGHLQRYFDRSPQSQAPAPASTQAPPSKSHSLSQIAPTTTTSPNVATSPNDTNVAKLAGSLASNLSVSNNSDTYYALPPSSSSEALSNASGTPQLTKRNFPLAKVNSASPGLEASSSLETTRSGRNLTNTFGHSLSVDRPSGPSTLTTSPSGPIQISSNRTSGSNHFLGSFNDSHMVMLNKSQSVVVGGAPPNTKTPKKAKEVKEQAVKSAAKGSNKKGSKKGSTKENKKPSSGSPKKDGPPNTSIESFAKECVARHRKGGIFSKKKTLKSMLTHTKKPLKRPMISTISDSTLVKESVSCFKMIQIFMRDRAASPVPHPEHEDPNAHPRPPPAQLTDEQLLVRLISVCVQLVPLRDEVLVQVARQVTANPSTESEQRGLELMCVLFWYFTASNKLAAHLHAFLSGHRNPFTAVVRRKFEQQMYRARHTHSVLFFRKPHSPEEVGRVLRCVRAQHSGLFGETLTDAVLPDGSGHLEPASKKQLPWPVVLLTEALLEPRHEDREGVFRCVGDMDDVHKLKMKIDTTLPTDPHFTELIGRGGGSSSSVGKLSDVHDLHVIASTLKLYFRELREAVIPAELYLEALDSAHSPPRACALLDRLPPVNRATLCYLIRFLQVFSAPDHVRDTKMDDANLSMVWAPNILRSLNPNSIAAPGPGPNGALLALTSANSANIYEQTRAEMSLVRTLIQHLDTNNAMVQ